MKNRLPFLFLLLFLGVASLVSAQPPRPDHGTHGSPAGTLPDSIAGKVDAVFREYASAASPGCALAILHDGQVCYQRGYGMATLEHGVAIGPASVFHVASLTKQFTAAAIVRLALAGKLSLADDVRKYVPQVPDLGHVITLAHLLHHTSGLRDQWDLHRLAGWRGTDVISEADILEMTGRQQGLNFAPGEAFSYSNTGYTLLGLVVKKVAGLPLRDYADSVFFRPLGMHHTHFQGDHAEVTPNRTSAYQQDPQGHWQVFVPVYDNYGSTGLMTTVADLARWDAYLYAAGDAAFGLAMQSAGRLNDQTPLLYASGLALQDYKGHPLVWHPGSDAGYRSVYLHFPGPRLSVILLGNAAGMNAESLAKKVADLFLPQRPAVAVPPAAKTDSTVLKAWAGTYLDTAAKATLVIGYRAGQLAKGNDPLVAVGGHTFEDRKADATYAFTGGAARTALEVRAKGNRKVTYRKIEPVTLPPDRLGEYAGWFYSPELDVWYTFSLREGALVAKVPRNAPFPLKPLAKDVFTGPVTVAFTRDAKRKVNGFWLTLGKTQNLRFRKTGERQGMGD